MSAPTPPRHCASNIPGGELAAGQEGGSAPLPPFAHVPGATPRHPDGSFASLRATVRPGMAEAELAASPAFRAGLAWLHRGYFWEAHEVLEPVWMALPPDHPARHLTQALIQLANARLKDRMARPRAAARLRALAAGHLAQARQARGGAILGLDPAEVGAWIAASSQNAR